MLWQAETAKSVLLTHFPSTKTHPSLSIISPQGISFTPQNKSSNVVAVNSFNFIYTLSAVRRLRLHLTKSIALPLKVNSPLIAGGFSNPSLSSSFLVTLSNPDADVTVILSLSLENMFIFKY